MANANSSNQTRQNNPRNFQQNKKSRKPGQIRAFSDEEKKEFGVVNISQIRERERMQSVGKIFDLSVPPILSYLDQIAPAIDSCLLYSAGFCKFGNKCPCLDVDQNAHNGQTSIVRQKNWLSNMDEINDKIKINKIRTRKQFYDYCVILDLEGLPEIVELPAILIDLKTFKAISKYHKYVIPQQWIIDKIFNKSHDNHKKIKKECFNINSNAVPFEQALDGFNKWLFEENKIDINKRNNILFATCGNWDIGKQIPLQCFRCGIANKFPKYFYQWINIKDFGLNFYGQKANKKNFNSMKTILRYLKIKLNGTHHSGMDDTSNLTKIVLTYIKDGAVLQNTAKRNMNNGGKMEFEYGKSHRIGW